MNFTEIAKSWITSFNPNENEINIANQRIEICNGCEKKEFNKLFSIWVCSECGCPLKKKIYTNNKESCPLKKWNV